LNTLAGNKQKGAWVATLAWPEVQQRIASGAAALLPIGAGAKEHGPHLPLNTDQVQVEWFTERLLEAFDLLAWPTVTYGYYPAFVDYPGSSHIEYGTFSAVIDDLIDGFCKHGIQQVLVLNTGISTISALDEVIARHPQALLLNTYAGPQYRKTTKEILASGDAGHAGGAETSILLAIAEHLVDMRLAPGRDQHNIGPGPLQWRDPDAANYSPSGIVGDARAADAITGKRLLAAIVQDLTDSAAAFLNHK